MFPDLPNVAAICVYPRFVPQVKKLLKVEEKTGISLTESFSMYPAASVSGLMFAHPESKYFFVGKIGKDQVSDYAKRKGLDIKTAESYLASNLNYSN